MPSFKDHFSGNAADYALFRPEYPADLFPWLARQSAAHALAVDVASGSGQAALPLRRFFRVVLATDASAKQLGEAPSVLRRSVALAERLPVSDSSTDLITVAQGLHWLDPGSFGREARRVLKSGGILAAWTYRWFRMEGAWAEAVRRFYNRVAPWWPPERRLVEAGYADIPLPGDPVEVPSLSMRALWPRSRVPGYLRTWSATKRCEADGGGDPVTDFEREVEGLEGDSRDQLVVEWDLVLRVTRL